MEVAFYLFKWFAGGCAIFIVAALLWELLKDALDRCCEPEECVSDNGCDHDYETFETAERWRIRQDLYRIPGGQEGRPSCSEEFNAGIPRLGESRLEKRICLKCGNVDDEITSYIKQAIEERNRIEARKRKVQEMLAEVERAKENQ